MQNTVLDFGRWLASTLWQDGGQRRARRNAWQAMLEDAARARARARADADAALREASRTEQRELIA